MSNTDSNRRYEVLDNLRVLSGLCAGIAAVLGLLSTAIMDSQTQITEPEWQFWHRLNGCFFFAGVFLLILALIFLIARNHSKKPQTPTEK